MKLYFKCLKIFGTDYSRESKEQQATDTHRARQNTPRAPQHTQCERRTFTNGLVPKHRDTRHCRGGESTYAFVDAVEEVKVLAVARADALRVHALHARLVLLERVGALWLAVLTDLWHHVNWFFSGLVRDKHESHRHEFTHACMESTQTDRQTDRRADIPRVRAIAPHLPWFLTFLVECM